MATATIQKKRGVLERRRALPRASMLISKAPGKSCNDTALTQGPHPHRVYMRLERESSLVHASIARSRQEVRCTSDSKDELQPCTRLGRNVRDLWTLEHTIGDDECKLWQRRLARIVPFGGDEDPLSTKKVCSDGEPNAMRKIQSRGLVSGSEVAYSPCWLVW